ncbi:MAG: hypothetical protein JKY98_07575 [Gammaproteobacteria bacterium]|nr:hypothetical protein [Gammaproteobacteria bacterium]
MADNLTLNDKTYKFDELSDEAKALVNNIRFAENKLAQLKSEAALVQTARNTYTQALTAILEKPTEAEGSEKPEE